LTFALSPKSIRENITQARQGHIFTIEVAMLICVRGEAVPSVYQRPDVVVLGDAQVGKSQRNLRPLVKGRFGTEEALHPQDGDIGSVFEEAGYQVE